MTSYDDPASGDEHALDAREMLALIETQTSTVRRALELQVKVYYFAWGIAWLVGYLVYWAGSPGSGSPIALPYVPSVVVFATLIVAAIVLSAVVGIRSNRGIKGTSDWVGTLYGLSWPILGTAIAFVGIGMVRNGLSPALATILFASMYAIMVAALYLAGAMLWRSVDQLVIAIIFAFAAAVTPMFGYPGNLLGMGLIAGPALLVGGVIASIRHRKL
jgi:hypothetical protein